jgi:release factor glutamine methyltransferase
MVWHGQSYYWLSPNHLVQSGWLLLKHGYDQAGECKRLFANAGFSNI